ncbi:hypothetical protein AB0P15_09930 [Streptomyces sp. NPDC087917]|uniref:hypothetical protein n=1 Tax=unclassified Streptomyces TaxID=2593676 RepID=UPI0034189FD5
MRIRHSLALLLAAATLLTGCGEKGEPRGWEPDDALQRADKSLGEDTGNGGRVTQRGTGFLASGLNKTLETGGESQYRFDIACDSEESPRVSLVLSRDGGAGDRSFDVACTAGEVTRINFPAGGALTARVEPPAKDDSPPLGVLSWQLLTLDPKSVQGCTDQLSGCQG